MAFKRLLAAFLLLILCFTTVSASAITRGTPGTNMPYRITVDLTNQIVTVYSNADGSIVRQMLCSSGMQNATPMGTFYMEPNKKGKKDRQEWYYFNNFGCYAKWASRIYKGIMFHSLTCKKMDISTVSRAAVKAFGQPASHGCLRLRFDDAEFIAKNCFEGTEVYIYKEKEINEELRQLLLESSFAAVDGMTYDIYRGIPDGEGEYLSRGSSGEQVEYLQMRLRALGYYADEIDGEFRLSTLMAVKQVQEALGTQVTGYVGEEDMEKILEPDVPTSMQVTITEGMSGPIVRNVQNWLKTLLIYDGDIDGIYDGDVVEAMRTFQQVYGYETDGVATPEQQSALAMEAERVEETFADSTYQLNTTDAEMVDMAVIQASLRVRIRKEPNTDSRSLDSLSNGTTVVVLEKGKKWSQVRYGSTIGYVRNNLMEFQERAMSCLNYISDDGTELHIGNNAQEYADGALLPAEIYEEIYTALSETQSQEEVKPLKIADLAHGLNSTAVVNTGLDGVRLNLRAAADSTADVLAELNNGTTVEVIYKQDEWCVVEVGDLTGYLLGQYLEYREVTETEETEPETPAEAEAPEANAPEDDEEEENETFTAKVLKKCVVYDLDSDDANKIGTLKKGTTVTVQFSDDEWTLIEYKGKQGYVQNDYLQFNMWEEYV